VKRNVCFREVSTFLAIASSSFWNPAFVALLSVRQSARWQRTSRGPRVPGSFDSKPNGFSIYERTLNGLRAFVKTRSKNLKIRALRRLIAVARRPNGLLHPCSVVIPVRPTFVTIALMIAVVCATVTTMVEVFMFLFTTNGTH
jgi:hypothetical protein